VKLGSVIDGPQQRFLAEAAKAGALDSEGNSRSHAARSAGETRHVRPANASHLRRTGLTARPLDEVTNSRHAGHLTLVVRPCQQGKRSSRLEGKADRDAAFTLSLPLRLRNVTMSAIAKNLAAALQRARERDPDLNQARLAALVGVSEATVARWLNGTRTPLMESLKKLADALSVQVTELVDEGPAPRTQVLQAIVDEAAHMSEAEQQALLAFIRSRR